MSDAERITGLEAALLARARKLADEYRAGGHSARERILAETNQRLRVEEEREVLAAKAHAERLYQQRVQAAELEMRSELDRMRWELVNTVLDYLPARLAELAADETRYLPLLLGWLHEATQAIERDHLVVQVNAHDLPRLKKNWAKYAKEAAPDKQLDLSQQTIASIGGMLVSSEDGDIRFDNTFEGRMEKLGEALQGAISEQLTPAGEAHVR
jgi:V/A-type H+/Na+-transporting ATPase subunit E